MALAHRHTAGIMGDHADGGMAEFQQMAYGGPGAPVAVDHDEIIADSRQVFHDLNDRHRRGNGAVIILQLPARVDDKPVDFALQHPLQRPPLIVRSNVEVAQQQRKIPVVSDVFDTGDDVAEKAGVDVGNHRADQITPLGDQRQRRRVRHVVQFPGGSQNFFPGHPRQAAGAVDSHRHRLAGDTQPAGDIFDGHGFFGCGEHGFLVLSEIYEF